jgi:hypothetical protein
MKKRLILLVALFLVLGSVQGYCATDLFAVGKSSDNNLVKITSTGILEGARSNYEVATTNDTLTAIESGKTIIVTSTSTSTFTLPADSLGLEYTLVAGRAVTIKVDPASTGDSIEYLELAGGDRIYNSSASTGDSIKLICGAANTWYVSNLVGTWADGN